MKRNQFKLLLISLISIAMFMMSGNLFAGDRCFGCQGGTYVRYTGKADNAARKKAKACGCKITGTAGCPSNKNKIKCTVSYDSNNLPELVCDDKVTQSSQNNG